MRLCVWLTRARQRWYIWIPLLLVYKLAEDWMLDWLRQRIAGPAARLLLYVADFLPLVTWLLIVGLVVGVAVVTIRERRAPARPQPPSVIPSVNVRIPATPNRARENWLEWLHLEAEPPAGSPEVPNARVRAQVGGQVVRLMWSTEEGPREERNLRHGDPSLIPVVLRGARRDVTHYGNALQEGVAYLTDSQFLVHRSPLTLRDGEHRLDVVVESSRGESVRRSFWVSVTRPGFGPMTLRYAGD